MDLSNDTLDNAIQKLKKLINKENANQKLLIEDFDEFVKLLNQYIIDNNINHQELSYLNDDNEDNNLYEDENDYITLNDIFNKKDLFDTSCNFDSIYENISRKFEYYDVSLFEYENIEGLIINDQYYIVKHAELINYLYRDIFKCEVSIKVIKEVFDYLLLFYKEDIPKPSRW